MPALAYDAWLARAAKLKGGDVSADGKAIMRALVQLMDEAQTAFDYADDVSLIPIDDTEGERVTRLDSADTKPVQ